MGDTNIARIGFGPELDNKNGNSKCLSVTWRSE